ncbi:hypothetical protein MRB53_021273 [Persea americana]|uniref:Uncharacterized protein n=1 Tax=Persea americana TaxID=3435 RepID=A0ACC2L471_PERAE|nr:hypothetical protein MRB53_021273 [Persea americana]
MALVNGRRGQLSLLLVGGYYRLRSFGRGLVLGWLIGVPVSLPRWSFSRHVGTFLLLFPTPDELDMIDHDEDGGVVSNLPMENVNETSSEVKSNQSEEDVQLLDRVTTLHL